MPFHKFVPREGKQRQVNSGKLSNYQPEVKRIACDVHEKRKKKHEKRAWGLAGLHVTHVMSDMKANYPGNMGVREIGRHIVFNISY